MPIRITTSSQQNPSRASAFIGGLICTALSIGGFYIAFSGAHLLGGIPFIPDTINQTIGRIVFAIGACITGALALYAFYTIIKPVKKESSANDT
jgi:hypothetical protein